ncbi:hypothetical protein [Streptomyces sp. NPDC059209]|uniref:hypothetical protein n=1 Tax=Streptomyces sp. NPDC059209 TaxID=3346769 RepID=UPI0036859D96
MSTLLVAVAFDALGEQPQCIGFSVIVEVAVATNGESDGVLPDRGGDFLAVEVTPVIQGGAPVGLLLPQVLLRGGKLCLGTLEGGQVPPNEVLSAG